MSFIDDNDNELTGTEICMCVEPHTLVVLSSLPQRASPVAGVWPIRGVYLQAT